MSCHHKNAHYEDWPDGSAIEVCENCGMSRNHIEWGSASDWIMVDIPEAREQLKESINRITSR